MTLRIDDLHFAYGRRAILHGVSLSARRGELLGLLGPNGSGKSTLIKSIARINRPRGSLRWEAEDDTAPPVELTGLSRRALARLVAYVPQNINVSFDLDVREAVVLGRTPHFGSRPSAEDWRHVDRAIELLGLGDLVDRSVAELSGGQAQRVLIARAVAQEPGILLLDEPTSALDIRYQLQTLALARSIARSRGVSAIIAIHDLNQAARFCDRVALLHGGRLLAFGTPRETLTPDLIHEVYGIEAEVSEYQGHVEVHPVIREGQAAGTGSTGPDGASTPAEDPAQTSSAAPPPGGAAEPGARPAARELVGGPVG